MPKRFKFPLDSVLKVRQHETEHARQVLIRATMERKKQEERLEALREQMRTLPQSMPGRGAVGPQALRQMDAYRQQAQRACEEAARQLEQLRQTEAQAQDVLLQKRRAEEALQLLFEQQRDAYYRDQDATEAAFLDEQALASFHRQNSSSHQ